MIKKIISMFGVFLLIGMFIFAIVEGWSLINSLYFSFMTLTTIGCSFGPLTYLGKILVIVYFGSFIISILGLFNFKHVVLRHKNKTKKKTVTHHNNNDGYVMVTSKEN